MPEERRVEIKDYAAEAISMPREPVADHLDEYEHFGNRRLRTVGELIQEAFRIGLYRMERVVRERLTTEDADTITPQTIVNIRPVVAALKEFFGSSQLSQFMDQTNSLAGLTHRRRLSALGAGGLTRERAPIEVRDVHPTHYGRMCPIETPEGPNIGLIGSLSSFAEVSEHGFVTTPYRVVKDGKVTDEIVHLDATQEEERLIAQANAAGRREDRQAQGPRGPLPHAGRPVRHGRAQGRRPHGRLARADLVGRDGDDPVPRARRRQPRAHGLEHAAPGGAAAQDRRAADRHRHGAPRGARHRRRDPGPQRRHGRPTSTPTRIVVETKDGGSDEYELQKFMRSNQGTLIHQKPRVVRPGQKVKAGDVLADGSATDKGEMALGKNLMVAFMSWEGYNFEDAIILSQRLVKDDELTSIHIEEYEIDARTTKLGDEEITRDIPNRSEESLRNLDDRGIVRIGAEVGSGDLLVGKVTPKGETELTAEEKLIRAIFKEKAREVRDTSLKVPARRGRRRHRRQDLLARRRRRPAAGRQRARARVRGQEAQDRRGRQARRPPRQQGRHLQDRRRAGHAVPRGRHAGRRHPQPARRAEPHEHRPDPRDPPRVGRRAGLVRRRHRGLQGVAQEQRRRQGLRLDAGVRRRDASRTSTTRSSSGRTSTPAASAWTSTSRAAAGEQASGKFTLFNGRTGEPFEKQVTVGYMYILKLLHLVDDKIHARSTGPYSLVTQQPLGGKAQFGGQRFGEMEVWALEAYGAAYTLQEMLTIKSDDTVGRVKAYEAIVKGENIAEPSIPESFKVLLKEMQSLALDVNVVSEEGTRAEMRDEDDDLLRAAEELGIDLSGVRAGDGAAADERRPSDAGRGRRRAGSRGRPTSEADTTEDPTPTDADVDIEDDRVERRPPTADAADEE